MKPTRRQVIEASLTGYVVLRRHAIARGNTLADLRGRA